MSPQHLEQLMGTDVRAQALAALRALLPHETGQSCNWEAGLALVFHCLDSLFQLSKGLNATMGHDNSFCLLSPPLILVFECANPILLHLLQLNNTVEHQTQVSKLSSTNPRISSEIGVYTTPYALPRPSLPIYCAETARGCPDQSQRQAFFALATLLQKRWILFTRKN